MNLPATLHNFFCLFLIDSKNILMNCQRSRQFYGTNGLKLGEDLSMQTPNCWIPKSSHFSSQCHKRRNFSAEKKFPRLVAGQSQLASVWVCIVRNFIEDHPGDPWGSAPALRSMMRCQGNGSHDDVYHGPSFLLTGSKQAFWLQS